MNIFHTVTIDGPAGAGKSTSALGLAERLGWLYLNSGFLYRAATLLGLRADVFNDESSTEAKIVDLINQNIFQFIHDERGYRLIVNNEDVTDLLKTHEVDVRVSPVAQYTLVRAALVPIQREIATRMSLIAEGRDTGAVIFPNASVKFYLTASPDVQTKRFLADRKRRGEPGMSYEEALGIIITRDQNDLRKHLRKPDGAIEICTDAIDATGVITLLESIIYDRIQKTDEVQPRR